MTAAAADAITPNPVALLEQTTARTKAVIAGVRQSQLDDPTPCSQWNVHGLLNHLIDGLEFTAAGIAGIPTAPMLQSGFADMGRQAGFIGPEQAVPDDASQLDKLIAYMGRQP